MSEAAKLSECFFCKRSMSVEFDRCPHCRELLPRIVRCGRCKQELSSLEAVNRYGEKEHDPYKGSYHAACYPELSKAVCSICQCEFTADQRKQSDERGVWEGTKCSNCGHSEMLSYCYKCGGPLTWSASKEIYDISDNSHFLHPACYTITQTQRAEKQDQRRKYKQCILCGKPLSFFDTLFGNQQHSTCDRFREVIK